MATDTKTNKAPAKKAEPTPSALDFSKLTVSDVENVAELKYTKTSKLDNSPVLVWLRESYEQDKGKAVTVPNDAVKELTSLLHSGAARLKIGVKVVPTDNKNGSTTVKFLGKPRRKYNPRTK